MLSKRPKHDTKCQTYLRRGLRFILIIIAFKMFHGFILMQYGEISLITSEIGGFLNNEYINDQTNTHSTIQLYKLSNEIIKLQNDFTKYVTTKNIGKSTMGNDITMIKLHCFGNNFENNNNKTIILTGGIHSDELSSIVLIYSLRIILMKWNETNHCLNNNKLSVTIICIPMINIDGYYYNQKRVQTFYSQLYQQTHSQKYIELRRTNMNTELCEYGIDLNRNFPKYYGIFDETEPEKQCEGYNYEGLYALSEYETYQIFNFMQNIQKHSNINGVLDFHLRSDGESHNFIIYPYTAIAINEDKVISELFEMKMRKYLNITNNNNKTQFGTALSTLQYLASGTFIDFMYDLVNEKCLCIVYEAATINWNIDTTREQLFISEKKRYIFAQSHYKIVVDFINNINV
eukprot:480317_1